MRLTESDIEYTHIDTEDPHPEDGPCYKEPPGEDAEPAELLAFLASVPFNTLLEEYSEHDPA